MTLSDSILILEGHRLDLSFQNERFIICMEHGVAAEDRQDFADNWFADCQ